MTRVLVAIIVAALGCAVWFGVEAASLRPSGDNTALADQAATASVSAEVGDAVKSIFSYDYTDLDRTRRAASAVLVGDAVGEYRARFDAAVAQAQSRKLVRTTTVRAAGVRSLSGSSASLLLFLDQQTIGDGAPRSSVAQLGVDAVLVDGRWKLSRLDPL